ncbi:MAG: hypothetical protein ACOYEW_11890 [Anaerolineae bacterium]|jgi:hypothetical protein
MQRLECPSCGAPLTPTGGQFQVCDYCSSRVRLEYDSTGRAVPVDLKLDTHYLAKDALYRRTKEEVEHLRDRYEAALADYEARRAAEEPDSLASFILFWGLLGLLVLMLGLADGNPALLLLSLGLMAVGLLARLWGNRAKRRFQERFLPEWEALMEERQRILELAERLEQLKGELDTMSRTL